MTPFPMFRFYTWASLAYIIGTAAVMALLYRNVAVHAIISTAENTNLAMARSRSTQSATRSRTTSRRTPPLWALPRRFRRRSGTRSLS